MTTRTAILAAPFRRSSLRLIGLALAAVCVVLPSLAWFSQPPVPIAALWCAYGWAAEGQDGWRAPTALALLGLAQDQLSGGPLGFYALIFVAAYLIGRVAANTMRSANLISPWMGFAATAAGACLVACALNWLALGGSLAAARPFAVAALVTALLFPLVRGLYLGDGTESGARA
jgi:cell shape-determining protein MreD